MKKNEMTPIDIRVKACFWIAIIIASIGSFYIFKDLADISQWLLQTPRDFTMMIWYWRHPIAIVTLLALIVAGVLRFKHKALLNGKVFGVIVAVIAFQWYSGYINPTLMMRDRNDNGLFVSVTEAQKYVKPDESVIVLEINGEARAHPDAQLLRPHVAGNGTLGGENVVMTYCGLTNMGIAYTPEINGEPLDLRPFSQLENNLVMYDANSGEPVQQFWGQTEKDVNSGSNARMKEWSTFRMPFEKFAQAYPDGEVFINDYLADDLKPGFSQNPFLAIYDPIMDFIFQHGITDQRENEEPTFPTIEHFDDRLANKTLIWGFNIGDDYVAYSEKFVKGADAPINVKVGGRDIVISYDDNYQSIGIYYNDSGLPVKSIKFFGEVNGKKMERVETVKAGAYWVVWANFWPQTDVNRQG